MSLEVGQILGGKYFIERVIGRGSIGLVYEGRDTSSSQRVAIRLIMPEFDNEQVPAFVENDATVVGQLGDEHIARLFNMGFLPSGERCIVSEYVEGEILQRRMKRLGSMSELNVAQLLIQLLESLSAAHEVGIVHRDLTPLSIIMVPRSSGGGEAVKLIDFGISRLQLLTANPNAPPSSIVAETESFQYLSPEQLNGLRELDPRSNIYTLGVIAYEAITGKLPFEGKDFGDLTFNILREDPVPVEDLAPKSSSPFVQLITRAMARSPNARFQYAEEMYAAISNWANRAGFARSVLESGVTGWRNHDLEEVTSSERASTAELRPPDDDEITKEPDLASPDAMPANSLVSASVPQEPVFERTDPGMAPVVETETLPFPATAVLIGTGDPFTQQTPVGLAEEDALFALPPTAPRDELPFVALEVLASSPVAAPPVERAPEQQTFEPPPAVAPASASAVPDSSPPKTAIAEREPTPLPLQAAAAPAQDPPEPTPSQTPSQLTNPMVSAAAAPTVEEGQFRQSRTILGIGGIAVRAPQSAEPSVGVVVRAPQSAESGINSNQASQEPVLAPFRPRLATEPGIAAPTNAAAVVASATQPTAVRQAQISGPVPAAAPAPLVQAATVQPAVAKATPAPTLKAEPPPPQPIAAPASDAEDMGPYGVTPTRSRKRLVVAVVLLGLAAAGVALILLQHKPEAKKSVASEPTHSAMQLTPSVAEPVAAPSSLPEPAGTASVAKTIEAAPEPSAKGVAAVSKKSPPSLAQLVASAVPAAHVAPTTQPRPQRPQRPVQSTPPATVSTPTKQGSGKAAAGYDPYKYR